jgi:hypothetical protein
MPTVQIAINKVPIHNYSCILFLFQCSLSINFKFNYLLQLLCSEIMPIVVDASVENL